jgi:hypothetical protein
MDAMHPSKTSVLTIPSLCHIPYSSPPWELPVLHMVQQSGAFLSYYFRVQFMPK